MREPRSLAGTYSSIAPFVYRLCHRLCFCIEKFKIMTPLIAMHKKVATDLWYCSRDPHIFSLIPAYFDESARNISVAKAKKKVKKKTRKRTSACVSGSFCKCYTSTCHPSDGRSIPNRSESMLVSLMNNEQSRRRNEGRKEGRKEETYLAPVAHLLDRTPHFHPPDLLRL